MLLVHIYIRFLMLVYVPPYNFLNALFEEDIVGLE